MINRGRSGLLNGVCATARTDVRNFASGRIYLTLLITLPVMRYLLSSATCTAALLRDEASGLLPSQIVVRFNPFVNFAAYIPAMMSAAGFASMAIARVGGEAVVMATARFGLRVVADSCKQTSTNAAPAPHHAMDRVACR